MNSPISAQSLNAEFVKKIESLSGQNVYLCYQCGKCSAGCPMSSAMDILPNQIIRYIQLGLEKEVLSSKTIWLCASCFSCTVRCPRNIDLAGVMEAARSALIRKNMDFVNISKLDKRQLAFPQVALISCFRKYTG